MRPEIHLVFRLKFPLLLFALTEFERVQISFLRFSNVKLSKKKKHLALLGCLLTEEQSDFSRRSIWMRKRLMSCIKLNAPVSRHVIPAVETITFRNVERNPTGH
jgi:hypothetical protein